MLERISRLDRKQKVIAGTVAFIYLLSLLVTYLEMQNVL